ncbi:MAG: ATP-binding protein, partial [Desulfotignum sp.]|nr:ATP-binding protein [Desulfotignum sp.]
CPCGYFSEPGNTCTCSRTQVQAYRAKISGPLVDRLDIQVAVPRVEFTELVSPKKAENSMLVRSRVEKARQIQAQRFAAAAIFCNARMGSQDIRQFCDVDKGGRHLLAQAADALMLSARACHSILKVARTIADLDNASDIQTGHLAEAIQYRGFDRKTD